MSDTHPEPPREPPTARPPEAEAAAEIESAEPYEPLDPEPPGEPVELPDSPEDQVLDARAKSVMPVVWLALGAGAIALVVAFFLMTASPPHRTPVFQAQTPASSGPS